MELGDFFGQSLSGCLVNTCGSPRYSQLFGPVDHADHILENHVRGIQPGNGGIEVADVLLRPSDGRAWTQDHTGLYWVI